MYNQNNQYAIDGQGAPFDNGTGVHGGGAYPNDGFGANPNTMAKAQYGANAGMHGAYGSGMSGQAHNQPGAYGGGGNPYPSAAPNDVARHVEMEDRRNKSKTTCLDHFQKLEGNYEQQMFMRKVFGILTAMTVFTVFLTIIVLTNDDIEDWLQDNIWVYWLSFVITICLLYALLCFKKVARKVPTNYIVCFAFTFFESVMVATLCTYFTAESCFIAAFLALALFGTMTLIALVTKRKPKTLQTMIMCGFILTIICIIFLIVWTDRYVTIIIMLILLVLTCMYVIIDIDLITEKHGLSFDDYIIGAVFLYMDLITLFMLILSLSGTRD